MSDELPTRDTPHLEESGGAGGVKLLIIRLSAYLTNYVIAHVPSFALRRLWYRLVLGVRFGEHAGIHLGCHLWYYSPGQTRRSGFRLGSFSRVNRDCCLDVRGGLDVGEHVSVSPDVTILTAAHGVDDPEFRAMVRPVVIEDHVWIGTRAIVLPGVRLGRGCVVAAGAVATRDVTPLTIVAGVPARPVGVRNGAAAEYMLDVPFPLFE